MEVGEFWLSTVNIEIENKTSSWSYGPTFYQQTLLYFQEKYTEIGESRHQKYREVSKERERDKDLKINLI